ncbi:MAG: DUF58 domain-containing protein [Gammaproteobacteria bacterium]
MAAGLANITAGFGRALRSWAQRRQGIDPLEVELHTQRIYILPTRAGMVFAVIILVMLLGAMNYSNNLGFALTFLLAAVAIVSINHCHYNLAGLRVAALGAEPVFVGEKFQFQFALHNARDTTRWQMRLQWDSQGKAQYIDVPGNGQQILALPLTADHRGLQRAPRLKVSTRFPLGLLESWAWLNLELTGLAYPRPAERAFGAAAGSLTHAGANTSGEDDFAGMRQWRPGDSPRRIAWKAFARTGQRLVNEYSGAGAPVWIDWGSEPDRNTEQRIAKLARRILNAAHSGREFGLRIPGVEVAPAQGPGQCHRCLQALALVGTSVSAAA